MKKSIVALVITFAIVVGCKEKAPYIKLTEDVPSVDSYYVLTPVPAVDSHNVLVEDFTGATCTNCPAAHDIILGLEAIHPGRINDIALHDTLYPQAKPYTNSKYDFRSGIAHQILINVYHSLLGMPIGGIDRLPLGANMSAPLQCDPSIWTATINNQLNITDSINLAVSSSYDAAAMVAKIKVTVTYLQEKSDTQFMSLAIVEDSFVDKQLDNRLPAPYLDTAYHFNSIFRGLVTSVPYGDRVAPKLAVKVKGQVYERTYTYPWNTAWKPANCRVIAFVTKDDAHGGAHVYQSKQAKIIP